MNDLFNEIRQGGIVGLLISIFIMLILHARDGIR